MQLKIFRYKYLIHAVILHASMHIAAAAAPAIDPSADSVLIFLDDSEGDIGAVSKALISAIAAQAGPIIASQAC